MIARRGTVGFVAVCLGYFAIILDGTVLNVAVPTIRADLGASLAGAQWVLNGYTLTLAALLLTSGVVGDRIGLRRTFVAGVVLFTLASAGCAAAPNLPALVVARVVQGLGAALLLPATLALIPHLFASRSAQARAAVAWVAVGAASAAIGPIVGGFLIDAFGWRSVFLVNLPLGVAAVLLGRVGIAETPSGTGRVDRAGQLAAIAALGFLTAGLIRGGDVGWVTPSTLAFLGGGVAAGVAFWFVERRGRSPMLPPSFFRHRARTVAVLGAAMMGFVFYGALFVMSLYFQELRGWPPGRAGLALTPLTFGSVVGPLILYRPLSRRFGHLPMFVAGFTCSGVGAALLATVGERTPYPYIVAGLLCTGVASTFVLSAVTSLVVAATPPEQAGLGSGLQNTARQTGALLAVSVLGSVLNTTAFTPHMRIALVLLVAVDAAGIIAGLVAGRAGRHRRQNERCDQTS